MKRKKENEKHAALLKSYIKFLSSLVHFKNNLIWGEKKLFEFVPCFLVIPELSSRQHMFWIRNYSLIQDKEWIVGTSLIAIINF